MTKKEIDALAHAIRRISEHRGAHQPTVNAIAAMMKITIGINGAPDTNKDHLLDFLFNATGIHNLLPGGALAALEGCATSGYAS